MGLGASYFNNAKPFCDLDQDKMKLNFHINRDLTKLP